MPKGPAKCEWVSLKEALSVFAATESNVQGQGHIRPLHWYIASRLVIEGGFVPDEITPRPPFVARRTGRGFRLEHDAKTGGQRGAYRPGGPQDEGCRCRGHQERDRPCGRSVRQRDHRRFPQPD